MNCAFDWIKFLQNRVSNSRFLCVYWFDSIKNFHSNDCKESILLEIHRISWYEYTLMRCRNLVSLILNKIMHMNDIPYLFVNLIWTRRVHLFLMCISLISMFIYAKEKNSDNDSIDCSINTITHSRLVCSNANRFRSVSWAISSQAATQRVNRTNECVK